MIAAGSAVTARMGSLVAVGVHFTGYHFLLEHDLFDLFGVRDVFVGHRAETEERTHADHGETDSACNGNPIGSTLGGGADPEAPGDPHRPESVGQVEDA